MERCPVARSPLFLNGRIGRLAVSLSPMGKLSEVEDPHNTDPSAPAVHTEEKVGNVPVQEAYVFQSADY